MIPASAIEALLAVLHQRLRDATRPIVVAIDGRSGSGKSTVAAMLAPSLGAVIVPADDFFAAGVTDAQWDARSLAERASDALDWQRLRTEALEPLRAGQPGRWHAFDFSSGARGDGSYRMRHEPTVLLPGPVVILDGAYSARPELADLIDVAVLVEAPSSLRHQRLAAREKPRVLEQWRARWDAVEEHYFGRVRPPASFDFVVVTG